MGTRKREFENSLVIEFETVLPVTEDADIEVAVEDHLSQCDTPVNGASGTTTVSVVDGSGAFSIASANTNVTADFTLDLPCAFFRSPCDVNDIDAITIDASDDSINISEGSVDASG